MSNTDCPSLLPPNATQFERDLERVQCRAFDVPTPHRDLFDPWKCPEQFLPFLAWAESVDVWNDRWPSQTKRAVIANSRQLHEIKGTDGAIEQALAALGVRVEMKMWHEETPPAKRGTMKLLLWVNDNINPDADVMIDSEMIRDFLKTVDRTKRNCVHYTFDVGIEFSSAVGYALSSEMESRVDAAMHHVDTSLHYDTAVAFAATSELETRLDANAHHAGTALHYDTAFAFAATSEMAVSINMDMHL